MIQICSLYSLHDISPVYYINTKRQVINIQSNAVKKVWITSNGYPSVTLATKDKKAKNVTMHKIVALAFIKNKPYKVIEHIDDNKLDYRSKNLKFSNQKDNVLSAIRNGKKIIRERIFKVLLVSGDKYTGSMKEISEQTGIARGTLYDHFYYRQKTKMDKVSSKSIVRRVTEVK
jgi:hypothetical protein